MKSKTKRRKGDPGTKTHLSVIQRRNKIKQLIFDSSGLNKLSQQLGVSRRTIIRDLKVIRDETLQKLQEISKEQVFLDFLEDLDEDQGTLKDIITKAMQDIETLNNDQRSALYNAVIHAIRTRARNRAQAIHIGQTLGIYPMIRPGIDVHITYEEKKELVLQVIESVTYPTIMKFIPREEDQRNAAREIDQRATQLLSLPGPEGASQAGKEYKRGRPRHCP